MMETKFTPGPWKSIPMSGVHGQCAIMTQAEEFKGDAWPYHPKIASVACMRGGPPREIGEANARLMAVAPELLEALVLDAMFTAPVLNAEDRKVFISRLKAAGWDGVGNMQFFITEYKKSAIAKAIGDAK